MGLHIYFVRDVRGHVWEGRETQKEAEGSASTANVLCEHLSSEGESHACLARVEMPSNWSV